MDFKTARTIIILFQIERYILGKDAKKRAQKEEFCLFSESVIIGCIVLLNFHKEMLGNKLFNHLKQVNRCKIAEENN